MVHLLKEKKIHYIKYKARHRFLLLQYNNKCPIWHVSVQFMGNAFCSCLALNPVIAIPVIADYSFVCVFECKKRLPFAVINPLTM